MAGLAFCPLPVNKEALIIEAVNDVLVKFIEAETVPTKDPDIIRLSKLAESV